MTLKIIDIDAETVGDVRKALRQSKTLSISRRRYITGTDGYDKEIFTPCAGFYENSKGETLTDIIRDMLKDKKKYPNNYSSADFLDEVEVIFYGSKDGDTW